MSILFRYSLFAVVATSLNLLCQRMVLSLGETTAHLLIAILAGTIVGLVIKYVLDKNFIFHNKHRFSSNKEKTFYLYTFTGIFTTLLFWATESIFYLYFKNHLMRETGAILGLAIAYVIKFKLDSKYVFKK